MSSLLERNYPEVGFGGFTDIDGTVAFYSRVNSLLSREMTVLDVGCGRGAHAEDKVRYRRELRNLRGKVKRVIGVDVDDVGARNPTIDEFRKLDLRGNWPVEEESIDLMVCDNVLEHVKDPDSFMGECSRVLRAAGLVCFRTPNSKGYVALVSRLVPNRAHAKILRRAQEERKEEDVFPAYYRCNTARTLTSLMSRHGIGGIAYSYEAEPSYMGFGVWAYKLGVWHQRLAPKAFRLALFAFGRKRAQDKVSAQTGGANPSEPALKIARTIHDDKAQYFTLDKGVVSE